MQFVLALIASFLPPRQRRWWGLESSALLQRAAFWGAILQTFGLGFLAWPRVAVELAAITPEDPLSLLLLTIREVAVDPLALLCAVFAIEGLFRALILLGMGEVYPSLAFAIPIALLTRVLADGMRHEGRAQFTLHRRRDDCLEQVGDKLVIATCRLKPEWTDAAVCYAGLFYKAGGPHPGQHGLPYTYILRPWPEGIIIRKTQCYDGPGFTFHAPRAS